MSIALKAFKAASWLALFKFISQLFSWISTIIVARTLLPSDYGLMEMATIIIGYALLFNDIGLGAAIIQKPKIFHNELSSVFWFSIIISIILTLICFFSSYFMAHIFNEQRIIPLIKTMSIIFIINGLQTVPLNLLKKELDFRKVGIIETIGIFTSCSCMILISRFGGGVWTLVFGYILLALTQLILIYLNVKWLPNFTFNFNEARNFLKFGITVALSRSLFYISDKSDKFFAGRAWEPIMLGYYSMALQLAQIPTEKIAVLINQVSFSALSQLQDNKEQFNGLYLNIIKITATLVAPFFVGGYLLGDELIKLLLNAKWLPLIFVFKILCLTQIVTALNAVNNFVHIAQGRPIRSLYFHMSLAILMPISFYFAVQHGLNAILIPWLTTYLAICSIWTLITLKKIGINFFKYLRTLLHPIIAISIMAITVKQCNNILFILKHDDINLLFSLMTKIIIGALFYITYFWFFNREFFHNLRRLWHS